MVEIVLGVLSRGDITPCWCCPWVCDSVCCPTREGNRFCCCRCCCSVFRCCCHVTVRRHCCSCCLRCYFCCCCCCGRHRTGCCWVDFVCLWYSRRVHGRSVSCQCSNVMWSPWVTRRPFGIDLYSHQFNENRVLAELTRFFNLWQALKRKRNHSECCTRALQCMYPLGNNHAGSTNDHVNTYRVCFLLN